MYRGKEKPWAVLGLSVVIGILVMQLSMESVRVMWINPTTLFESLQLPPTLRCSLFNSVFPFKYTIKVFISNTIQGLKKKNRVALTFP